MLRQKDIQRFADLFTGSTRVYGVYRVSLAETSVGAKVGGQALTLTQDFDEILYQLHLEGTQGLGIVPIRDDDTCLFGCIDIDEYGDKFNAAEVSCKIYADAEALGCPVVCTRSKSGGLHVWVLLREPLNAGIVHDKLRALADALGYPAVEIFPKQKTLKNPRDPSQPRLGNWINLPYYAADSTVRHGYDIDGRPLRTLNEFVEFCLTRRCAAPTFKRLDIKPTDNVLFGDGPPCVQKLARQGVPAGGRDNTLYQIGVYLLRKGTPAAGLEQSLHQINHEVMHPPVDMQQLVKIARSLQRNDYGYKCNDVPMREFCNRTECIRRPFGVGSGKDTAGSFQIDITELRKYVFLDDKGLPTDNPAFWELTINDVPLRFQDTDLMHYTAVKSKVFGALDVVLPDMPKKQWEEYLRGLLERVDRIVLPKEYSFEGQVLALLRAYIRENNEANRIHEIKNGLVYYDERDDAFYFQMRYLLQFLRENGLSVAKTTVGEITAVLKDQYGFKSRMVGKDGFNSTAVAVEGSILDDEPLPKPRDPNDDASTF